MAGIDETRTFIPIGIAVLTISDTRTEANDESGDTLIARLEGVGHTLAARAVIIDDPARIAKQVTDWANKDGIDVIITNGGTGVTGRDVTPEALRPLFDKEIEGFGELFRMISYDKVGTSTMQSRALGGLIGNTYVFALPGSPSACKDGWDEILKYQLDARHRPCNLVELMPRLMER
ncbi:MAG: molybdenum cofactor biosynthesis protein B [Rhodospirillales bacterium]|jgi:molybdenum cofactor biosynthesis protein B|nr:molybdenum cofactor biosynthesis protein B [Rhodospirillales bacterium]MBT4006636.1 molybdenum cofactor biosynthesis protein B [Rhodospirillales bacterium]MBT5075373.1 molybdenum cofactor biosynthesis protein B [Rhodospirillales bacterium]MBT5113914.1 molybdenum cofactor biosynthesis protein B [Rhodospirillales bacterium]MBT5672442.1 molybdenum cofactor biosynthesis protein B [Rhodospirillales bacterium]